MPSNKEIKLDQIFTFRLHICLASHKTGPDTRSFYSEGWRQGGFGHKPRLVCCRTLLIIGSQGAIWTGLAFSKSPGTYARWPSWLWLHKTRRSSPMLVIDLLLPEGDLARAKSHLAWNNPFQTNTFGKSMNLLVPQAMG